MADRVVAERRQAVGGLGPDARISRGEWRARRTQASSRPSTTKPRGLSRSEATLAISRFGATPTEMTMPERASTLLTSSRRTRSGFGTSVRSA
jgi:hypothetical protein